MQRGADPLVPDEGQGLCGYCRTRAAGGRGKLLAARREAKEIEAAADQLELPPEWDEPLPVPRPSRPPRGVVRQDLWAELSAAMFEVVP